MFKVVDKSPHLPRPFPGEERTGTAAPENEHSFYSGVLVAVYALRPRKLTQQISMQRSLSVKIMSIHPHISRIKQESLSLPGQSEQATVGF